MSRISKSQAVELAAQPGMTVPEVAADLDLPVNALYRPVCVQRTGRYAAIKANGVNCCVNTVAKIMRQDGLKA